MGWWLKYNDLFLGGIAQKTILNEILKKLVWMEHLFLRGKFDWIIHGLKN